MTNGGKAALWWWSRQNEWQQKLRARTEFFLSFPGGWVGFMVTTHFDLVSGPFHSPNFIGLHSVSTSANMYHLNPRAGELPRSASSHLFNTCGNHNGLNN